MTAGRREGAPSEAQGGKKGRRWGHQNIFALFVIGVRVGLRPIANGKSNSMAVTKQRLSLALANTETTSDSRKRRPSLTECLAIKK